MADSTPSAFSSTKTWHPGAAGFPVLLARYQVLGVIGEGGMGTVYKGYHLNLKRFVAIKTLRLDRLGRPELVRRFLREMEVVGQMDHPNVVRASDAGEKNGICYLVMEYLDGVDLEHVLARHGPLNAADACALAQQAALGLDYIHDKSLVHRDVKPSNLLLTTAGLVKVLDLGLARLDQSAVVAAHTPEGVALGTYDYIAPEQAAGAAALDGRADVYSLGCTLFKLVVGRAPFSGPAYDTLAKKLFAHERIALDEVDGFAGLPAGLQAVLARMTAKDPARRCPAAEVARVLAPLAAGSQVVRLLGPGLKGDDAVRPLPPRTPEEFHRLTEAPHETPLHTPGAATGSTTPRRARRWIGALAAVGLGAAAVAGLAWAVAARWLDPGDPTAPSIIAPVVEARAESPRVLDGLPPKTHHTLLDQPPLALGPGALDRDGWRWEPGPKRVDVKARGHLLLELGTTDRPSFTFEAGIEQVPWSGGVGLFWGYREDAVARAARRAGQEFAGFQMLFIEGRRGEFGQDRYVVRRGRGSLRHNTQGEVYAHTAPLGFHEVGPLGGETILQLVVERDRLHRVRLGATQLDNLTTGAVDTHYRGDPCRGGLGLLSLSHTATFSNVHFMASK